MGHINLAIQQEQHLKWYILSHQGDSKEVWLTEVNESADPKIIASFHAEQFKDCFCDLKKCLGKIGEVKQLNGSGIKPVDLSLLEDILISKSDRILPVNKKAKSKSEGLFWNWLQHDHYMAL